LTLIELSRVVETLRWRHCSVLFVADFAVGHLDNSHRTAGRDGRQHIDINLLINHLLTLRLTTSRTRCATSGLRSLSLVFKSGVIGGVGTLLFDVRRLSSPADAVSATIHLPFVGMNTVPERRAVAFASLRVRDRPGVELSDCLTAVVMPFETIGLPRIPAGIGPPTAPATRWVGNTQAGPEAVS
jgi:hypothetical protein